MISEIIDISQFDYHLPDDLIARFPLHKREDSNLLVYQSGIIKKEHFFNLSSFLKAEDLLVFNNTKVVPARLIFTKKTGAVIEILCLEPHLPLDYQEMFAMRKKVQWKCFVGNAKRWKDELIALPFIKHNAEIILNAQIITKLNDGFIIEFSWNGNIPFAEVLQQCGHIPIPPYLARNETDIDRDRYQTVYSNPEGSVAAPTAGLHFTPQIFDDLKNKNIHCEYVTLHVGAGTFQPVKTNNAKEHVMHGERFVVSKKSIENILNHLGTITAVGTTSVRTLETLYWLGVKCIVGQSSDISRFSQWDAYQLPQHFSAHEALNALLEKMDDCLETETSIMIVPGYQFRIVNRLITNFHQPKSTLLLLISAFVGENRWKEIYDYALKNDFRFLSYGDSSLLIP